MKQDEASRGSTVARYRSGKQVLRLSASFHSGYVFVFQLSASLLPSVPKEAIADFQGLNHAGETLERSAFLPFTVANLHFQLSCEH